ncbi:uncharacterized protein K452DRAFT_284457 [Aplosporella prunicola CBS 121167]|uniref:BZIP domain-containing protein n=1 Tax=Aplosporella prunicola CBS 121167 TaxID=1176127 RepID=A0A6A6BLS1_9PEZI|nr:uncharacterized protein K452DRAFT_284457 [Aplosporella prunicola CBS 121167]KAF2145070.1 hypothetical protein K452DRAFT_284457 [Aplosporella prunicola CBS 121167]
MTASPSSPFLSPQSVADAPATINMQDLQRSTPLPDDDALSSSSSPAPAASHSNNKKEPKKRKSWGQVLPEPKTNLPPRKRAKTADEKEQRRIERVKRNRLAAHNSRERKREEMDRLTAERDHFRDTFRRVFSQLKQLESQNEWYRARATEKLPELPNMSANIEKDNFLLSAINGTPAPELPFSAPTPGPTSTPAYVEDTSSIKRETSVSSTTMNPREASFSSPAVNSMDSFAMSSLDSLDPFGTNCREGSYASPTSLDDGSYDSPINTASQPATPRDERESTVAEPDLAQHSAAMLCWFDLQCQSGSSSSASRAPASRSTSTLATFLLFLTSLMSMMTFLSASASTTLSPTLRRTISSRLLSLMTTWEPSALMSPLASLMTCKPTQAQLLLLATGQELLRKPSFRVAGKISRSPHAINRERVWRKALRSFSREFGLRSRRGWKKNHHMGAPASVTTMGTRQLRHNQVRA